jgi:hypothetical protein
VKRTERFGFSAINASRCLCSALRARAAEKHGAQKGNDRGGLLRFARKAARCLPFRAFTGCPKLPLATGRQPFSGIHRMPEIAFGNRSATLRISSDDGKKQTPRVHSLKETQVFSRETQTGQKRNRGWGSILGFFVLLRL